MSIETDMIANIERMVIAHDKVVSDRLDMAEIHVKEMVRAEADGLEEHIDKKFAGVHRSIHSSDKTARVLIDLVKKQTELEDGYIWKCPKCGEECLWDADNATDGGTPMCIECDIDMNADRFFLFDSEEWKAADAHVLRINQIKATKDAKKKSKLKFKKNEATATDSGYTNVYMGEELLGPFFLDEDAPADKRWAFCSSTDRVQSFYAKTKKGMLNELKKRVESDVQ